MEKLSRLALGVALIITFCGRDSSAKSDQKIVATVNGVPLRLGAYRNAKRRLIIKKSSIKIKASISSSQKRAVLQKLIDEELIRQAVNARHITITEQEVTRALGTLKLFYADKLAMAKYLAWRKLTIAQLREEARLELGLAKIFQQSSKLTITEAELRAYYEKNATMVTFPLRVRLSQVAIKIRIPRNKSDKDRARKTIEKLRDKVKSGAAITDIARRYSTHRPSAREGGDIGFQSLRSNSSVVLKDLFKMPVGALSQITSRHVDMVFYQVTARRPAGRLAFETVKEILKIQLIFSKMRPVRLKLVKSLRGLAKITINERP